MNNIFDEIFNYVKKLKIIDTHEHLHVTEGAREKDTDILKEYLLHYFSRDLISAGLKEKKFQKVINNKLPLMERWKLAEPFWEASRYTGYGRALDISVKELYGIEKICGSTIEKLNEKFLKSLKPGHYKKVLKDKSNIETSIIAGNDFNYDKNFFRLSFYLGHLIKPDNWITIHDVEKEIGITITCIDDWLEATEKIIDKSIKAGIVSFKCGLAYHRTLLFEKTTKKEAEEEFNKIFKVKNIPDWEMKTFAVEKKFQDYMMHFILRIINKKNFVYQFHTGIQEGNGNIIYHSDPALLSNLFLEYPDVKFDIFHIGYPYQQVVSVLAKTFPNVYIDMCWAHIISPVASINALIEWIDSVPANKICAFGGDYCFVDAVYGHQYMARENVSKALAVKVEEGVFNIDKAKEIAEMFFYKNPKQIFNL